MLKLYGAFFVRFSYNFCCMIVKGKVVKSEKVIINQINICS